MNLKKIVFIWENFGPQHHDRLEAAAKHFGPDTEIVGIELSKTSDVYKWEHRFNANIRHLIIADNAPHFFRRSLVRQILTLFTLVYREQDAVYALCHYERPVIFLLACVLRLFGRRVLIMNDSKFDDYDRSLPRELLKSILYAPYQGALVASYRAAAYVAFLGIRRDRIELDYDNLSRERIRSLVHHQFGQKICAYENRDFFVIARLVEKKNLFRTLDAYAKYRQGVDRPRRLVICGYGHLEQRLKDHAESLGVSDYVEFTGYLPIDRIAKRLTAALALLLFSTEEQFGQVVLEAQSLSIPVIVSSAVGATDCYVRNGINGFVVEAYDVDAIAHAMGRIANDPQLWESMSRKAEIYSDKGDVRHFASSLDRLIQKIS